MRFTKIATEGLFIRINITFHLGKLGEMGRDQKEEKSESFVSPVLFKFPISN